MNDEFTRFSNRRSTPNADRPLAALDAGQVVLGGNTRPAYLEQGRSELRDELTVIDEVGDGYDFVELPDGKIYMRSFLDARPPRGTRVDPVPLRSSHLPPAHCLACPLHPA